MDRWFRFYPLLHSRIDVSWVGEAIQVVRGSNQKSGSALCTTAVPGKKTRATHDGRSDGLSLCKPNDLSLCRPNDLSLCRPNDLSLCRLHWLKFLNSSLLGMLAALAVSHTGSPLLTSAPTSKVPHCLTCRFPVYPGILPTAQHTSLPLLKSTGAPLLDIE